MRPAFLLVFTLAVLATPAQAQPLDLSTRIDSIAQAALDDGPLAGLSIAVMRDGEVRHARGYGLADIETGRPVTAETLFNVASVGKIIAAAAVLRLVDEGTLSLDDDLASLLPAFPNPEQGRQITLRQLLNHTSGLNDYVPADLERWKQSREPLDPSFVLDYVRDRPLDFEPGTDYSYTNTGFYLAGLIVERVSGSSWGDYVLREVAAPLGLHSVVLCDEAGARRTTVYDRTDAGLVVSVVGAEQGIRGDGGLCMNVLDLARLPHALRTSGLLSASSLEEMLRPTVLADGLVVDYGLGVARGVLHGHPLWGHLGGAEGSLAATLIHYPDDDVTIAVVVNTRFGDV
ncbi:MAG: serine hydrolase domain-containing protein, partial [Rhodothermales bacterium]|nr:serine hydrolase domain-containing protein [Rhodothermales bacterium]